MSKKYLLLSRIEERKLLEFDNR